MNIVVFDLEGDGLTPTKIHVVSEYKNDKLTSYTDYKDMKKVFEQADILVGHNITRFDIPIVEKLLGIKVTARLVDTLAISWYLYPKRLKHGLADWGEEFGVPKPKIDDWENLAIEEYINRCEEDVKINTKLWNKIVKDMIKLYGSWNKADRMIKYLQFKMDCARLQEANKWKLDVEKAKQKFEELENEKNLKLPELIKAMPDVPIISKKKRPAKPFKKDGSLSATGTNWFNLLKENNLPKDYDGIVEIVIGYKEPKPTSSVQVKNWLFELGWEPIHFVYKRDKDTGDVRKIPQIKSEVDDSRLCDSVLLLCDDNPAIRLFEGLSTLVHRIGFFKSFLDNVDDGYVQAEIAGLTNTLRFKHKKPLANIPSVNVPYGYDIRSCLIAPDGYELCGSDMSSLEDRTKLHYMYAYDPEYVKEMSSEGFDPHLDLALQAGKLTLQQVQAHKDGEENHSIIRHIYKTANYACIYGSGAATVARGAGITIPEAEELIKVYWERNWAVKQLAEDTITKTIGGQMWLYNPVSRFWYSLRYKKDIFSTLNQGTGVYAFDTWVKYILSKRKQLTGQFHDEIILTIKKGSQDKCKQLIRWAINKTNEQLKLNRELDVDIQFGNCYADIH